MHLATILAPFFSGGSLATLAGLAWRADRWAQRIHARLTYLEKKTNGLYDHDPG